MHRILILAFLAALGGCSDISSLLSFDSKSEDEPVTVVAAAPAAALAAPDDSFCRDVAMQDATRGSFDAQTQKRVAAQSYAQCRVMYQPGVTGR